ncbi:vacuolar protein sorting-associated protein 13 isoform X4 [Hermetia illucens]|uniref:vacuolar protein sorting-associated protein 13 isoform X4 n=1 Tax=Hermetia illucens TaxID=343691 RepID=UPI0018CBF785|nr:vacuolar protein sorting-associated protein 13 isoform X4 [Hermetia illucens]
MVFESLVADLLNKFIGDYVEDLDRKQLSIGIWGGDVVLTNLALRANAFQDLDLPIQIVYGHLGKLVLKIPWKNLYSERVVAQVEDLYILVAPNNEVVYNAEKEAKNALQNKLSELQKMEDAKKKEREKDKPPADKSFSEKLTAQIVNNLQIKISNVHIRYEDKNSADTPFCVGVTLHGLNIYTTDSNWIESYMTEQLSKVFKVANLDSLSIYMNTKTQLFTRFDSREFPKLFLERIATKDHTPENFNYVLAPISSMAKLQLNMNPEYDSPPFVIPKIDLGLDVDRLNLGLGKSQYQDLLKLGDSFNRMQLGAPYRKYRPYGIPYRGHYKEWWKFAITCVLETKIRKRRLEWSWEHMHQHRKLIRTYADVYKQKLLAKKPAASLIESVNLCEEKLDVLNLILIREQVNIEVEKIKQEEEKQKQGQGGWFSGWFGSSKKDESETANNIAKQFEEAMTPEEKQKLYQAIGYHEGDISSDLPAHYAAIKMRFLLSSFEVCIHDEMESATPSTESIGATKKTILGLKLSLVTCDITQRPAASAIGLNVSMKELKVTGFKKDNHIPTIIESQLLDQNNLLSISFETNPLDKSCDQRVQVQARPLQIVYDAETVIQLAEFFTSPKSVNLSELEGAASERLMNIKERSATGIQYMVESHSKLMVHISLMPNVIIIPYGGVYISGFTSAIIISLGSLDIKTIPRDDGDRDIKEMHAAGAQQEEILQEMMKRAYDKFSLTINDIQILMAKPKEKWMAVLTEGKKSEMHLLRPIKVIIQADLCVVGDDPRLPKTKVKIEIPSIGINVTDDRVIEAVSVVTSIPFPEGKAPEETSNLTKTQSLAASTVSLMRFLDQEKAKMAKKAAAANTDLAEEIVQYTDLEAEFVLTELKVSIYKARADSDKDTPSSDQYKTPVDEFTTDNFDNTMLSPTGSSDYDKILSLQIVKLAANVAQRTYEMVASVKLGAIQMDHYDKFDNKITVLPIIDSPRYAAKSEDLLAIDYTNANKISPEFITKYNSTEQLINFNFSKLVLTLHQECLQNLLKLAADFQTKMAAFKSEEESKDRIGDAGESESIMDAIKTTLDVIQEEPGAPTKRLVPSSKGRGSKVVDSIKIKVNANMDQVAVIITCRKRPISHLKVKSLKAGVVIKSSYTELAITLRDIVVTDLNPETIHKNILSIIGDNALNVQVVLFNLDETANYNSDDMKIAVTMGCVRIVFLNWFVTSVLTFLNNFQAAQQALADASAAAAGAAKDTMVDAYSKATRIRFDIKIKAPIIIVPVDSQSLRAIALDLGHLCITNVSTEVDVPNNERSPAVLDEIKLELRDMKLSKVTIGDEGSSEGENLQGSPSAMLNYGLRSNINILDPLSISLIVNRNLTASWYKEHPELDVSGRLHTIELNLFVGDYVLLMSIMSKNLTEGQDEFPQVYVPPQVPKEEDELPTITEVEVHNSEDHDQAPAKKPVKKEASPIEKPTTANDNKKMDVQLKFNFQVDGIKANLINASNEGLASLGFYVFSLKGQKLADGTLSAAIVLCDIQLVDIRPNSDSIIKKFLRHKKKNAPIKEDEDDCGTKRPMLDITASIKDNDTFAEVRICGFDLIISIAFLTQVADFFKMPDDAHNPNVTQAAVQGTSAPVAKKGPAPAQAATPVDPNKRVHLVLHLEEPDIILVENMVDLDTYAIIFNSEVNLKVRMIGEKQIIFGEIKDLKMYMCSFHIDQRENTKHYIIHPCTISLRGSTPEGHGLNIHIKFTDIVINISPATIELINKALSTVTSPAEAIGEAVVEHPEHNDLWGVKDYKEDEFWFMKIKEGVDVANIQRDDAPHKPEECIIEIPLILLVIETGVGYYTSPMLMLDTKMNAHVNDWSQQMRVTGFLTMSMAYYNSALAVWEPLIEENERKLQNGLTSYGPWELSLNVKMDSKKPDDSSESDQSMMEISVRSDDTLELTVTKTAIEVLKTLGQAFSEAIDKKGLVKPEFSAPYILQNDTGFDISIDFTKGPFTLHECHLPSSKPKTINNALVFQTAESQPVALDNVTSCTVSPGGKVFMKTKIAKARSDVMSHVSILSANAQVDDDLLYVQIGKISKEVALPINRADERYFPLYRDVQQDPWGIVSSIKLEYGSTVVTVHGVVKVYNHFTIPVTIYRISHDKPVFVGEVQPGELFNVPLHAIYAPIKDLHFSFPGYKSSVQGFNWKECPSDLNYTKSLQCDPVETFESLYITGIREKQEIFHENTSKNTLLSAVYIIHLKPPLYLRNALPIDMKVSVAGCSVGQDGLEKAVEIVDASSRSVVREEFLDYGEKTVSSGDSLHLPTFKLKSSSGEGHASSYIVVRLIQYLEKDWSCTTEISEDHDEFAVWRFTSYDSVDKMDIELGVKFENRGGSLMLTIYCPFLMINKTGLMLSYRAGDESINVLYHPPNYEGPILFSFREKLFFGKKRAAIRVDNGEWSDKFPLDVAGSAGVVECKANDIEYQIGVHNHFTQNSLTKMITFLPFYVLINKAYFPIEVQEDQRSADPWIKIPPNECVPFWPKADSSPVIRCKAGDHPHISRPFKYNEAQCTLLMMKNKYGGINVDVQVSEGGNYITFTDYHVGDAPGLIINHTNHEVSFWEKGNVNKRILKPKQKMLYTWSDPAGDRVILWDSGKDNVENDLRRDGVDTYFTGPETDENNKCYWVSFLDGTQRVLLFTDQAGIAHEAQSISQLEVVDREIILSLHGIGLSIVNNMKPVDIVYIGIASSGVIWESRKKGKTRFKQMKITHNMLVERRYQEYLNNKEIGKDDEQYFLESGKIQIDFDKMVLYKTVERELRRTHYPGIWVQMKTSPFQTQLHAKINRIQIDDQLPDCVFPVVLAPVAPPKSVADTQALRPFIECSVVERIIPHSTVKQFKYATMLIQEFHVKVDLMFLSELSEMFSTELTDQEAAEAFNKDIETIQTKLQDLVATQSQQEQKHFYDNLHLGPLKMHVSFSMAGSETKALPGILSTILQGVGVTLTDVNDVVFRLSFFEREYQFFTQRQLTSEIVSHYAGQAVKQLYVLVLGLDVLGNPYGLVVGIKKGVEDLFYEPFQGAIQGPGEFAEGLVLGVKSLFGHTVGGAAGAVSKITGAMGKGLAALTFDKEYQRKRREQMNKKPATFSEGIARSGKGLVMGVVDGVTGVVTKPIAGAKEEGVEGFFKGLGKGAVGLVARPTAGIVDFASGTFESVKRATETTEDVRRLRPPRYLHSDNVIRNYSLPQAQGNKLLKEIEKGKYANTDSFQHLEEIVTNREVLLLSDHRAIYGMKSDLFGSWAVQWAYRWEEVHMIRSSDRGLEITLKKEGKKVMGLFTSVESSRKIILIPQKERRDHVAKLMDNLKQQELRNTQ